jgi:AraC-like DNA-binding protein
MKEIVRAEAWKGLRELITSLGGDADDIFAAAHVDVARLQFPDRYLPLRTLIDTVEIAARRLNRPDFGLLSGSLADQSVLGALSIAAVNSPTGREGLAVTTRYLHIHNPALSVDVAAIPRTRREFVEIQLNVRNAASARQYFERNLAALDRGLKQMCGDAYRPIEIWVTHPPIAELAAYRKVFGVTPRFHKLRTGIMVDRATLDAFQPGRSAKLRELAETYLRSANLAQDESFTSEVTNMTRALISTGDCSPEQIARALGIHTRTLQRRLKTEGTTFEKIKDDIRREITEALLAQPSVSLSHIAYILAYTEPSALSRSCRRWFGETPGAMRRRLLGATPVRRSLAG